MPTAPANTTIDMHESESCHFAKGMNGYKLLLVCFIGSFTGVVVELLWCLTLFFVFNSVISLAAVGRWSERIEGLAPSNAVEELLDERFHDERMERIYANMEW